MKRIIIHTENTNDLSLLFTRAIYGILRYIEIKGDKPRLTVQILGDGTMVVYYNLEKDSIFFTQKDI